MFERINTLVKLQLGHRYRIKKSGDQIWKLIFKIAGFFIVGAAAYLVMFAIKKFVYLTITNSMILFIIFFTQVLTLLANAASLTKSLYGSKDNAILLSLPAHNSEIYISKLIVFYLLELYGNAMFLLPILAGYGLFSGQGLWYYFAAVIITFLLPIVSVLAGALLSIPLSYVAKLFRKFSILYGIFTLGIVGLVFYFVTKLVALIPVPFRLVALYNSLMNKILVLVETANSYALFYKWFSNFLFNIHAGMNIVFIILLIIGLIIANMLLSQPLFFKLSSHSAEDAVQKKHKGINKKSKSTFLAFYKKEVIISIRCFGKVLENYLMIICMPIILYLINSIFLALNLSTFGQTLIFGINILIGLMMMIASNTASSMSLSEEGSEFVLLKTSPANTQKIAWAKIANNILISTFLLIVSLFILAFMKVMPIRSVVVLGIIFFLVNCGHIMWSFQLDLRNPQIKDVALTGTVSNQVNVTSCLTIGTLISVVFGALAVLLSFGLGSAAYLQMIDLAVLFVVWRFIVFRINLKVYFYDIEL